MSGQSSADYHRARAAMELQRAEQASDPKSAALHLELAKLHQLSAGDGEDQGQDSSSATAADRLARSAG